MRSEVADGSVALESLLEGTAASFVHVHSAAMLALVSAPTAVRPEECPETLLFDVHRLALLQREFRYEVTAAALLLTATNGLAATKKAADMQASARHLQHPSCRLADYTPCADTRQVLSEMVELLAAAGNVEMDVEQVFAHSRTH